MVHNIYDATDPYLGPMLIGTTESVGSDEDDSNILQCIKDDDLEALKKIDFWIQWYEGYLIDALYKKSFKIANWCYNQSIETAERFVGKGYQGEITSRFFYFNKGYNPHALQEDPELEQESDLINRSTMSPLVKDIVTKFLYPQPYEEKPSTSKTGIGS